MRNFKRLVSAIMILGAAALFGCGGGGGASSPAAGPPVAAPTVTGVAAAGAPISGTVFLKDSVSPLEHSKPINADGSYSFDVTGLTAPFILKVVGTANGQNYTLYSLAGGSGVANVNPLTQLAVVQANAGVDPSALYDTPDAAKMQSIKNALPGAVTQVQTLLQPVLSTYGAASDDFVSGAYSVNHAGLDLMFDMVNITAGSGQLTVTSRVGGESILSTVLDDKALRGQITSGNIPAVALAAGTVFVYPASTSVATGGTINFKSIVVATANQAVTWSVLEAAGGSITGAGVYTAPAVAGSFHVKATSVADTTKSATATVTVSGTVTGGTGTLQAAFTSGLYVFLQDSFLNAGVFTPVFEAKRTSLGTNGMSLVDTFSYLNSATNTWSATPPVGFAGAPSPSSTTEFFLTAAGWVAGSDDALAYSVAFNADGSAVLTNKFDGSSATANLVSMDISGLTVIAGDPDFAFSSLVFGSALVYPAGSALYKLSLTQSTDHYFLFSENTLADASGIPITSLAQVPTVFADGANNTQFFIDNALTNTTTFATFVAGGNTVNIFAQPFGGAASLIGTGTYATSAVDGQQILEVSIPSALRVSSKLGNNKIVAIFNGVAVLGDHATPGTVNNLAGSSLNQTAANFVMANAQAPALAKRPAKLSMKSIFGR